MALFILIRQTETAMAAVLRTAAAAANISRKCETLAHYAKLEKLAVTSRALITFVDVHDLSLL